MEHRIIDQRLNLMRDKLLLLGGATETALQRAMRSLTTRDSKLARQVLEEDKIINQMELEIDRMSVEILALQQPAARDLRMVISVAKITPILERIADHAANIADAAIRINDEPELKEYLDLNTMAENAAVMLRSSLDAFTSEDAAFSRQIIEQDHIIDASYKRVFDDLVKMMADNPSTTASVAQLLFVAKHLERIGDYVKDICELTVYMREAVFIKHSQ
ncbi:MAG TPA: phosphate signaling complex protein PhoU [Pyrinomonadaceae bacterium]|nr:phosphate signaling complex protein PhoU [Pyrinomonadaceae bacterium]